MQITIRVDVVAGEHLRYVQYVKYRTPGDKITATVVVMNYAQFHVPCKERDVNSILRTLNLRVSKPASVPNYGFTMTRPAPSNSLAYGLIYCRKHLLCVTDCVKVFRHDCLVTPTNNTFCCSAKRSARYRFTPGFCPKQPKSEVAAKFYPLHPAIPLPRR